MLANTYIYGRECRTVKYRFLAIIDTIHKINRYKYNLN
jgi:hypothetical protein